MKRIRAFFLTAMLLAMPGTALAQMAIPDPAGVTLPPMRFGDDPKVAAQGFKFFFFHNPAVSYEEAFADFAECRAHLPQGAALSVPSFVPWVEATRRPVRQTVSPYGLVGGLALSIIMPKMERGRQNNIMRLCMGRRGYVRYAVDAEAYEALQEGNEAKSSLCLPN